MRILALGNPPEAAIDAPYADIESWRVRSDALESHRSHSARAPAALQEHSRREGSSSLSAPIDERLRVRQDSNVWHDTRVVQAPDVPPAQEFIFGLP